MFIDTHCHIHDVEFFPSTREEVYNRAIQANTKMICVGTSQSDSENALNFVREKAEVWAIIGVHPHDTHEGVAKIGVLLQQYRSSPSAKIVGIGEIGLDYYYDNSPRDVQITALEQQLQWAMDYNLPVSFHVREAFDDFWPIFANFKDIKGVLHSFTDSTMNMERALSEGLYIGVNGISTFTKQPEQQNMYDVIPLEKIVLETDAPFLTPNPHRGKVNEPAFVRHVAEYHAKRRGVELEHLARVTSANASQLFSL